MTEKVVYNDPTPNNFPDDYDDSQVDSRVKIRSKSIAHKMKGEHVRDALIQGVEIGSVVANEAKNIANDTASRQDESERIVQNTSDNVNNVLSNITDNAGDSAAPEVIAARKPELEEKFPSLGARLDKMDKLGQGKMYFPKIGNYQEDCALLNLADKWIIIDTGDDRDWDNIKSFIMAHTDHIDIGIISHYHDDHVGNMINIINDTNIKTTGMTWYVPPVPTEGIPAAEISKYTTMLSNIKTAALNDNCIVQIVDSDLNVKITSLLSIQFLNTSPESYAHYSSVPNMSYNDYSLVALIQYDQTKMLFTGDIQTSIGKGGVYWFREHYSEYMRPVDFLKINHHGYDDGYQIWFYAALQPKLAIAMLAQKNMAPVPGYGGGGQSSTSINVLDSLGTKISYAYMVASNYSISRNGVVAEQASYRLRGTVVPTVIHYWVEQSDELDVESDGSEGHPFTSFNQCLTHLKSVPNIEYKIHVQNGSYPALVIQDITTHVIIAIEGDSATNPYSVTFESIRIVNCSFLEFWGDVHITSSGDRVVHINASTVSFGNKLIADALSADKSTLGSSRFLATYGSNVVVADVVCIGHSVAAIAYGGSNLTLIKAEGVSGENNPNLYGIVARQGMITANELPYLPATTLRYEDMGGHIHYQTDWTNLTTMNGLVSSTTEPMQFRINDNVLQIRGSIDKPNPPDQTWTNVVQLPVIARPQDGVIYRSTAIASNGASVPAVFQDGLLKIKINSNVNKSDLLGFNLSIPIY